MSGEKYKTITQSEYDRLRREAMSATTERERRIALQRLNDRLEEARKAAERNNTVLSARVNTLTSKINEANAAASDLKKQLYETVKSTNKAVADLGTKFERDLVKTKSDFANVLDRNNRRIEDVMRKNDAALREEIWKLRNDTTKEIKALNQQIAALEKEVGEPQKVVAMGKDYLDVALELLQESKKYRHELLLPDRINNVITDLQRAKNTLDLGAINRAAASAALVHCQEAFESSKAFYDDLLAAENEWTAKMAFAMEALGSAEARIAANKTVTAKEKEFDVDYWSGGGLKKLQDLTDTLRGQLTDPAKANALNFQDLEDIAASAQLISGDADQVLVGARIALECSEERAKTASRVAKGLAAATGMEVVKTGPDSHDCGYEGNDLRAAYMVHLKNNLTGFEVVITMTPDFERGPGDWKAITRIVNSGNDLNAKSAFLCALESVMKENKLAVPNFAEETGIDEDPTAADALADWKERKKVQVPVIATPATETISIPQH